MRLGSHRIKGFTLLELMVTVTVIVVLTLLALPSFEANRQRAALRGSADQVVSFWNQARLEAAKRNSLVKVNAGTAAGGAFCLGAATTTDLADVTPCDCMTGTTCNVARFPADQSEWKGVTMANVTLGNTSSMATIKPAIIEGKRTALIQSSMQGLIALSGPPGRKAYKLNFVVDKFGRGRLCEPTVTAHLAEYANRICP